MSTVIASNIKIIDEMIQQGDMRLEGIEAGVFGFNFFGPVETIEPCMRGGWEIFRSSDSDLRKEGVTRQQIQKISRRC